MCEVVAARIGGTFEEANSVVSVAADLKNCALYGLGDFIQDEGETDDDDDDLAVVASLPKDVFVNGASKKPLKAKP